MKSVEEQEFNYYKRYYKNDLGFNNWDKLVNNRLNGNVSLTIKRKLKKLLEFNSSYNKVLIVGGGTGDEIHALENLISYKEIHCIEPCESAFQILKQKFKGSPIILENVTIENCNLEERFDLILCFTVLEHVNNWKLSIDNMINLLSRMELYIL